MKKIEPKNYVTNETLICDNKWNTNLWLDWLQKVFDSLYNVKFYYRHGVVDEKVHEVFWFEESKWLEKHIPFITRKRKAAKSKFEKKILQSDNQRSFC